MFNIDIYPPFLLYFTTNNMQVTIGKIKRKN